MAHERFCWRICKEVEALLTDRDGILTAGQNGKGKYELLFFNLCGKGTTMAEQRTRVLEKLKHGQEIVQRTVHGNLGHQLYLVLRYPQKLLDFRTEAADILRRLATG